MAKVYETLEVWQLAIDLAVKIYKVTKDFPKEEMYGLTSQIRRATISISSNIAEGSGRSSKKEYKYFVEIAMGSLNEVESLWILSYKLKMVNNEVYHEIKQMI
ncbi:MAG: four helix bundle protein [bacterium]